MLKLGIIGLSEGNGHPYSWSAIFNGFDSDEMAKCPFTAIPEYLQRQSWPEAQTVGARVTHIWTQKIEVSRQIAKAALIPNIVENIDSLIEGVDAVLLARDDAENHLRMALPIIESGLPIYIDKPFALNVTDAKSMWKAQKYDYQVFTCSALRFAKELILGEKEWNKVGDLLWVEATVPKYWDTYSIHALEPILMQCKNRGRFLEVKTVNRNGVREAMLIWENMTAYIRCMGILPFPIDFIYQGTKGSVKLKFHNAFDCFKNALEAFLMQIQKKKTLIPMDETKELVSIIESGRI